MRNLRQFFRRSGLPSSEQRRRRYEKSRRNDVTRRRLLNETLEKRELLASDLLASHNIANRYDVNADNQVTALDALGVINYLSGVRAEAEAGAGGSGSRMFYDVNNDKTISAADALGVINALSRGEGEPGPMVTLTVDNLNILEPDINTIGNPPPPNQVGFDTATFTATLSEMAAQPVTVDLNFGGTATLGTDYTRTGTQIVIPAGQLSGSVSVTAIEERDDDEFVNPDDANDPRNDPNPPEDNETVLVEIANVTGAMEMGEQSTKTLIREFAPLIELVLTPRTVDSDPLFDDKRIPQDADGAINVQVGEIFDLEVSHDDRRFGAAKQGMFKILVDLIASQPGVLMPILNETQGFEIDNPALTAAAGQFPPLANPIRFSIPQFPPGVDATTPVTLLGPDGILGTNDDVMTTAMTTYDADIFQYGDNATNEVTNALLQFGYTIDQFDLSTTGSAEGFGGFEVQFRGDELANIDLPNLAVDVIEAQGQANIATTVSEVPVMIGGAVNSASVANNIITHSRDFEPNSGGSDFYSLLNEGGFDPALGFIGVGGVGQGIRGGGIPAENTPSGSFDRPFDSFSIRLKVTQPVNNLRIDVRPGADDEASLLYGRDDKTPSRLVLLDDMRDTSFISPIFANADKNETTGVSFVLINAIGVGNAPPVISVNAGDSDAEGVMELLDGAPGETVNQVATSGTLTFTDANINDTHVVTDVDDGANYLGDFTAVITDLSTGDGSGQIRWDFSVSDGDLDSLAEGQQLVQTYTVTVTDNVGAADTHTVTITITGKNDAPLLEERIGNGDSSMGGVTEIADNAAGENIDTLMDMGTLTLVDPDLIDTHTLAVTPVGGGAGFLGMLTAQVADPATGDGEGSVKWTFEVDDADLDFLSEGQQRIQRYNIRVTDSAGGIHDAEVEITINGSNDAPTATDNARTISKNSVVGIDGNVITDDDGFGVDSDPDTNDVLMVTEINGESASGATMAAVPGTVEGMFGNLTVLANGNYDYTVNTANPQVANLQVGQMLTDTFTYEISDGNGGTDVATLTITVTGVNDPPTARDNSGSVEEDGAVQVVNGNLITDAPADTDPNGDALTVTAIDGVVNPATDVAGTYGSVDWAANGDYTYTLNNASAVVQALAEGQMVTDTFTYTISDGRGGTDTADLIITVTGDNDAPVARDNQKSTSKDAPAPLPGNVITDADGPDTDIDALDVLIVTEVTGTNTDSVPQFNVDGMFGSLVMQSDGSYSYTVDQGDAAVIALGPNDPPLVDTFVYTIDDQSGEANSSAQATLTITITGVNDPPVARNNADSVTEDIDLTAMGNLITDAPADTDANGDTLTVIQVDGSANTTAGGNYGTLVWAGGGAYTYTLNNGLAAVQGLGVGDALTDTFTYTISDGNGGTDSASLVITINGNNDPPVASNNERTVAKGNSPIGGNMITDDDGFGVDIDIDGDSLSVTRIDGFGGVVTNDAVDVIGEFGDLNWSASGGYSYTIDETLPAVVNLQPGQTLTETFTYTLDDGNATDEATLTITITAVNPSTVSGAIFINHFVNGDDNQQDADESGLTGVSVSLVTANPGEVVQTTVTDITGAYTFREVVPGDYLVVFDIPDSVVYFGPGAVPVSIGSAGGQTVVGQNFALHGLDGAASSVDIIASSYLRTDATMSQISDGGREGGIVSLDANGDQEYLVIGSGYEGIKFAELTLNNNKDAALLTIVEDDNDIFTALLSDNHFVVTDDCLAVQFFGGRDDLDFVDANNAQSQPGFANWRNAVDKFFASING